MFRQPVSQFPRPELLRDTPTFATIGTGNSRLE